MGNCSPSNENSTADRCDQIICINEVVPLRKRPIYQAMFGAMMGVASIAGPLIGGGFTSNVTWRWCFYINLPLGSIAMPIIFFCLDVPNRDTAKQPLVKKLSQIDVVGTACIVPGIVSLLLALQWGGTTYAVRLSVLPLPLNSSNHMMY